MGNGEEKDREEDESMSSGTTDKICGSFWKMKRTEPSEKGEPVWLTPHLRKPQPKGERERDWASKMENFWDCCSMFTGLMLN